MNRNHKAEECMLIKCCQVFPKVFNQCLLTWAEAKVTYKTIYLPMITYPFPATFLSEMILEKAQSLTMPVILSILGYNQNMPKTVVYTPASHGRLRLHHLHNKQGLQKILQMIKHLWAKTSLGNLIELTIQAYQMQAGLAESILIDTSPLPWTPNWWLNNLRRALHTIQGQIVLRNLCLIPSSWTNDRHLMTNFIQAGYHPNTLKLLNNCRMSLQVMTLAKITNSAGMHLLPKILAQGQSQPTLACISTSNYNWPTQTSPGQAAWKIWTKTLHEQYTKPGLPTTLWHPLGQ